MNPAMYPRLNLNEVFSRFRPCLIPGLIILLGCASPGQRLERSAFDKIKQGVSTQADVEKILGLPLSALEGSDGKMVVDYSYGRILPGSDPTTIGPASKTIGSIWKRTVSVLYDSNRVVLKKSYFESESRVQEANDKVWVGHRISDQDVASIKPGQTTFGELVQRFGRPSNRGLNLDGKYVCDWRYAQSTDPAVNRMKERTIQIIFADDGMVVDFQIHGNTPTSR